MKKGVLLLAHGSRRTETEQTMASICDYVSEDLGEEVKYAFLQFSDTSLEKGLDGLVKSDITDIRVVPYFLFEGMHINVDIPEEIEKYKTEHPNVTIRFGRTLGADPRLAEVVVDRIREMS